ncbi:PASTA domain-containing protein [Desulfofustis glycolicus]|uniref:PASTA domain-containing protein n=1 Tax=Desulfofustis glycolicus DSM 9705 TaxID=1121409 RepID=A0A1M5YH07_9BACT|nr:PASTA domain-containing protein [Desulfofustis glycolicus]MCB2217790.1 PASTA domain-containing protein [Desulfobulbaceae bacterium]SHI11305.1 PASTA domain-containing protein [Desulfofustis glycolicus DSM 9705]
MNRQPYSSLYSLLFFVLVSLFWSGKVWCFDNDAERQIAMLEADAKQYALTPRQILERLDVMLYADDRFSPRVDRKTGTYWVKEGEEKYLRSKEEKAWMLKRALKISNFDNMSVEDRQRFSKIVDTHMIGEEIDKLETQQRQLDSAADIIAFIDEVTRSDGETVKRVLDGTISPSDIQFGATVLVPDVTGKKIVDAVGALEKAGLNIKTRLTKTKSNAQANLVFAQDITAGTDIAKDSVVTLDVYILGNDDIEQLNAHLLAAGLPPVLQGRLYSPTLVPPYTVGRKISEAVDMLQNSGFKILTSITKTRIKSAANIVYAQDPMGKEVPNGSVITLSVYAFDETAAQEACSEAYGNYRTAMTGYEPDLNEGSIILAQAAENECWFTERAEKHYAKTKKSYEKALTEQVHAEKLCQELFQEYKEKMASKGSPVDFSKGRQILSQAQQCDWFERAEAHYVRSEQKYQNTLALQEDERLQKYCKDLAAKLDDAAEQIRQTGDISELNFILSSSQNCDWYEKALVMVPCLEGESKGMTAYRNGDLDTASHWARWGKSNSCAYTERLSSLVKEKKADRAQQALAEKEAEQRQNYCHNLAAKFDAAAEQVRENGDIAELNFILSSSQNCAWHEKATAMVPCLEGESKAINAYNNGDLDTASQWTRWGKSKSCSYAGRLSTLIGTMKADRDKQQHCRQLAQQFDNSVAQANQALDSSVLKSILASAEGCSWHARVSALIPCVDGEYNGFRAYNSGDMPNALSWSNWGKKNNCSYTARLEGLINQQITLQQQQIVQQKPGFWETVGQGFAKDLEAYNNKLSAQMQMQTQRYVNQAIQQQFQEKDAKKAASRQPLQQKSMGSPPPKTRQPSQTNSCAHIDAQLLAACNARNVPLGESLYEQAGRMGCNLSPATDSCIDRYIDEWMRSVGSF